MIPQNNNIPRFEFIKQPSKTYNMNINKEYIDGFCDSLNAVKQAVYKILNTERYIYSIYSWNYGIELKDLFGQQMTYVIPELERRITEALIQDDRIIDVKDFEFERKKNILYVTFYVVSTEGEFSAERTVII